MATLPGLPVPSGEPAINPEPRKQIGAAACGTAARHGYSGPLHILLEAPEGLAAKFELAKEQGGQFIEFYYQEMDRAGYGDSDLREICRLSAAYNMPVTYHLPWSAPEDDLGQYDVPEGRNRLCAMMERGFAIGAKYMVLHLGAYPDGERRRPVLIRVRKII